jgi:serine/threonine protein kinase
MNWPEVDDIGAPSCAAADSDCRTLAVGTTDEDIGDSNRTSPDPISDLDIEVQAMFERVRVRLGMRAPGGPEMLGRYELRDWIGRGGMGEVYRAYDTELERDVALKVIAPRPGTDPQLLRVRLRREAQLLARLDHENLVTIHDSGSHRDRSYLVMEFVNGATLRQLQAAGTLSGTELLRLYAEAGRGLLAAHARGVSHRDFKPENVFVGADGRARVGDFGLAHVFGEIKATPGVDELDHRGLTQAGGTLGYMAPEQLRGETSDASADQYAFCASLWEALGGRRPYSGANAKAMLDAMERPPQGGERIDARLRRALRVGLAARAEARHPSIAQVIAAIEEVLERPKRRKRRAAWLGLAAAAGIIGSAIGYRATHSDCELANEITNLRDETDWDRFERPVARTLERRLGQLRAEAERACIRGDVSTRQHVQNVLHSLRSLLAAEDWRDHIEGFEADFASKASVPMTPVGYGFLAREIQPLEEAWALEQLVAKCDEIEPIAWPQVDRAGLLLPCARARGIRGDWDGALDDFLQARASAELVGDRTRRLQATLGAARLTITRLQNYDLGRGRLEPAEDLLRTLDVPIADPRLAEHEQLSAILLREQAKKSSDESAPKLLDDALRLQRRAVARQLLAGPTGTRVRTLINLGILHEARGEPDLAEAAFRMAYQFEPEDPEAAYNLGRFLVNEDRKLDEARVVLSSVLAMRDHDLQLTTTTALLNLEFKTGDIGTIAPLRTRLTEMLLDERIPRTSVQAGESWLVVAATHACLDDRGPAYQQALRHVPKSLIGVLDQCNPAPEPNQHEEQPP